MNLNAEIWICDIIAATYKISVEFFTALLPFWFCRVHEMLWMESFFQKSCFFCKIFYWFHSTDLFFQKRYGKGLVSYSVFVIIFISRVKQPQNTQIKKSVLFLTLAMLAVALFFIVSLIFAPNLLTKPDHSLIKDKFFWGGILKILYCSYNHSIILAIYVDLGSLVKGFHKGTN